MDLHFTALSEDAWRNSAFQPRGNGLHYQMTRKRACLFFWELYALLQLARIRASQRDLAQD
ncbi:unnamed protein product [Effrenium voratum]|uniref:Uncharacterized protein n=1 Tax=Effrenium voratum TaxID=2562239 RepID=A0AA36N2H7_9DINO|nr:unnamed protein product [Effrenium voratum]